MVKKEYNKMEDVETLVDNKIILLVGAGVSIASPSKLPSGKSLTDYYLESSIGDTLQRELTQCWEKINSIVYNENKIRSSLFRLEFIIGCVNDVDSEFSDNPFILGFYQFTQTRPNMNHACISALLRKGCKIITPNFDCAIEKTFNEYEEIIKTGVPTCVVDNNGGDIYHYHGIGTKCEQLGATILQIKKGLPREFRQQLLSWFEDGYSIITLGFSCSDYFDMTPFFDSLSSDKYEGIAIFFQHGDTLEEETEEKVQRFFKAFKKKKNCNWRYWCFLARLMCTYGQRGYGITTANGNGLEM